MEKTLVKKICTYIQKMGFTPRFWMKFFQRKNLNFSTRKSDQKRFSATELENFRLTVDRKMMFYPVHTLFKKFAHFEEASDPEVSSQDVENELNEKLELACSITEA